jgi:arylsulfatase A-like enzyme
MVTGIDQGIGRIVGKLRETGELANTLIFYLSDNGGHTMGASNLPFRGHKGMLFEGGIRVPFLLYWPDGIDGGRKYAGAISSLDIFPTILSAAGIPVPEGLSLDGTDLIPILTGTRKENPHENLFWRYSGGAGYAVLHGDYKLIRSAYKGKILLFNLAADPGEQRDLSMEEPEMMDKLLDLYNHWEKDMVPPLWSDPHLENVRKEEESRRAIIDRARAGEKKK